MKDIVESINVESCSSPGVYYTAVMEANGRVSCNCRGWTMKRAGKVRTCTHTTQLLNRRPTVSDGVYMFLASRTPARTRQAPVTMIRLAQGASVAVAPLALPPLPTLPVPGRRRIYFNDE